MSSENPLLKRIDDLSFVTFEPTFTFFDNTTVINYKKVGSRFFETLCKAPIGSPYSDEPEIENYTTQIDARFMLLPHHQTDYNILNLKGADYLVEFDCANVRNKFNSDDYSDILKYAGSHDINSLLKNPSKKITFVIKNPLDRFLSGAIQIMITYIQESLKDEGERNKLKKYTGLTDSDIKYVWKRSDIFFSEQLHHIIQRNDEELEGVDKFIKICVYILETRFDLLLQDIHSENYLDNIKFLVDAVENDNYQIIDIDDCTTRKAYKLFDTFSNTIQYSKWYEELSFKRHSNKHIYQFLYNLYTNDNSQLEAIPHLLKKENIYYQILKSSKHFVSLK